MHMHMQKLLPRAGPEFWGCNSAVAGILNGHIPWKNLYAILVEFRKESDHKIHNIRKCTYM